jgi:hypothetical protein
MVEILVISKIGRIHELLTISEKTGILSRIKIDAEGTFMFTVFNKGILEEF